MARLETSQTKRFSQIEHFVLTWVTRIWSVLHFYHLLLAVNSYFPIVSFGTLNLQLKMAMRIGKVSLFLQNWFNNSTFKLMTFSPILEYRNLALVVNVCVSKWKNNSRYHLVVLLTNCVYAAIWSDRSTKSLVKL